MKPKPEIVDPARRATYLFVYEHELREAVANNPEDYIFGLERVREVVEKVVAALCDGSGYNLEGRPTAATCKALKIRRTYEAIAAYLEGLDEYA